MQDLEPWFKIKKYPHIGMPITIKDYNWVKLYVENPDKVRTHSFMPLLHKTIIKRKFRANTKEESKNPSGKRKRVKLKPKIRDTFFASHLDSIIFSKYNADLVDNYEKYIEKKAFNESVIAYRKVPVEKGKKGNKCIIDFAKMAFEFIQLRHDKQLSVIVADITSFFDKLDHKILKKNWSKVINSRSLLKDHYNLFKALTRIRYVESQQLFEAYDNTIFVERGVANHPTKKEYVRKKIKETKYFKEKNAVAFCDKKQFIKNNLNLIIEKSNDTGIPQGNPISATLANIYMLVLLPLNRFSLSYDYHRSIEKAWLYAYCAS